MTTPLAAYMETRGIKDADLAPALKLDRSMVSKIRRGVVPPTLQTAVAIELATDGDVPLQAWKDTVIATADLAAA